MTAQVTSGASLVTRDVLPRRYDQRGHVAARHRCVQVWFERAVSLLVKTTNQEDRNADQALAGVAREEELRGSEDNGD